MGVSLFSIDQSSGRCPPPATPPTRSAAAVATLSDKISLAQIWVSRCSLEWHQDLAGRSGRDIDAQIALVVAVLF